MTPGVIRANVWSVTWCKNRGLVCLEGVGGVGGLVVGNGKVMFMLRNG